MISIDVKITNKQLQNFYFMSNLPTILVWVAVLIFDLVMLIIYDFNPFLIVVGACAFLYLAVVLFRSFNAYKSSTKADKKLTDPLVYTFNAKGITIRLKELDSNIDSDSSMQGDDQNIDKVEQPKTSIPWQMVARIKQKYKCVVFNLPKNNIIFIPKEFVSDEQLEQITKLRQAVVGKTK